MQKKIIALAVAGLMSGAAFAQSNVTVYGNMDVGYIDSSVDQKVNGTGIKSSQHFTDSGFQKGALSTSRLGFKGSEELGNGMKANFIYELAIASTGLGSTSATAHYALLHNSAATGANSARDPNGGESLATRLAQIGLSGTWGAFDMGRQESIVAKNIWTMGSAGGKNNAVGSLFDGNSGIKMADDRYSSVLTYTSPNMSGFQVAAQYGTSSLESDTISTGVVAQDQSFKVFGLTATYANGPVALGLGYSDVNGESGVTAGVNRGTNEKRAWVATGSYDFGVAKIFGIYTDGSNDLSRLVPAGTVLAGAATTSDMAATANQAGDSMTNADGWELGVQVPMGQFTFIGSYFNGQRDYRTNATNLKYDADVDGFQLAALYSLSKRTMIYAMYGELNNDFSRLNSYQASNETQQWAVGMNHKF